MRITQSLFLPGLVFILQYTAFFLNFKAILYNKVLARYVQLATPQMKTQQTYTNVHSLFLPLSHTHTYADIYDYIV